MADGSMTTSEAGRRGGEQTARKYGKKFFREIGRRGGEARSKKRSRTIE